MGAVGITTLVTVAEDEGVRAILRPHIFELGCVPERLVSQLRHADRVRGWACASSSKAGWLRVVHVRLMVGAVEVLAVPASINRQPFECPSTVKLGY